MVFRDVLIIGGFLILWMLEAPPRVRPLLVSKLNTALQIGLAALALGLAGFHLAAPVLLEVAIWATAACTLVSGAAYVWLALRRVPA